MLNELFQERTLAIKALIIMVDNHSCFTASCNIFFLFFSLLLSVPQFLPAKITVPELKVFAILETNSPLITTVQLQGRIEDETVSDKN